MYTDSPSKHTVSDAEILTLIRAAYDGLLDPLREELAEIRVKQFVYSGPAEWIGGAILFPASDFKWHPHRAYLMGNDITDDRLIELEGGTPPTANELSLFRDAVKRDDNEFAGYGADVYRLAAPAESNETRPVFFVDVMKGCGMAKETVGLAGPFTDLKQVESYLEVGWGLPDEWWVDTQFPEEDTLRGLRVSGTGGWCLGPTV